MAPKSFETTPKARPGDRVAVISPAFAAPAVSLTLHEQAMRRLTEATGLIPVEYPTTRQLGASAEARAADVTAAFADPSIKAVLATIGGDDQLTVIPHIEPEAIPRIQRQHEPAQPAVEPRRAKLLRRFDPGTPRARPAP